MRSRARRGDFAGAGLTPSGDVQRRGQASAERRDGGAARRRGVGSESALSEAEGGPMYERHSACVSAHVDARVTAVRARVIQGRTERASRPPCSAPVDRCSVRRRRRVQHRLCEGTCEPAIAFSRQLPRVRFSGMARRHGRGLQCTTRQPAQQALAGRRTHLATRVREPLLRGWIVAGVSDRYPLVSQVHKMCLIDIYRRRNRFLDVHATPSHRIYLLSIGPS